MKGIDLNCDLGEGAGHDAVLMRLVTSANIACGTHAGDEATMRETFELAVRHGVGVGAHPGFNDRPNFGRAERTLAPEEAVGLVETQIAALHAIAGEKLRHVKLHGALYNQVSRDTALAEAVAGMLARSWPGLALFALSGSELWRAAQRYSLRVAGEVFADRTYRPDGSLTPRSQPGALIAGEEAAVAHALRMIRAGVVRATDGTDVPIAADTICVHGDRLDAAVFARRLRHELAAAGIAVKAFPRARRR